MGYNRIFRKWTLEIIKIGASATGAACKRKRRLLERKQSTAVDSLLIFFWLIQYVDVTTNFTIYTCLVLLRTDYILYWLEKNTLRV